MITEVERAFRIPASDILSTSRKVKLIQARQLYIYLLYKQGFTHVEIANLIGLDRTTIIYTIKKIQDFLDIGDKITVEKWNLIKDIKR